MSLFCHYGGWILCLWVCSLYFGCNCAHNLYPDLFWAVRCPGRYCNTDLSQAAPVDLIRWAGSRDGIFSRTKERRADAAICSAVSMASEESARGHGNNKGQRRERRWPLLCFKTLYPSSMVPRIISLLRSEIFSLAGMILTSFFIRKFLYRAPL